RLRVQAPAGRRRGVLRAARQGIPRRLARARRSRPVAGAAPRRRRVVAARPALPLLRVAGVPGSGWREPHGAGARAGGVGGGGGLLWRRPAFQYSGGLLLVALGAAAACQGAATCQAAAAGAGDKPPRYGRGNGAVSCTSGQRRGGRAITLAAPYLAGVLIVAAPWVLMNGLVFGQFAWSRTGDAWHQVYWGIYPPNDGWWP